MVKFVKIRVEKNETFLLAIRNYRIAAYERGKDRWKYL